MTRNGVTEGAAGAPRPGRGARDQKPVRELNEQIAARRPSRMFIEFACECSRRGCRSAVALGVDEYEAVRRRPGRYAVLPGHERDVGEQVVESHLRYTVIEKPLVPGQVLLDLP